MTAVILAATAGSVARGKKPAALLLLSAIVFVLVVVLLFLHNPMPGMIHGASVAS